MFNVETYSLIDFVFDIYQLCLKSIVFLELIGSSLSFPNGMMTLTFNIFCNTAYKIKVHKMSFKIMTKLSIIFIS